MILRFAITILMLASTALPMFFSAPAAAAEAALNPKPFGLWVQELKAEAAAKGVKPALLDRAFRDLYPNERIVELDRKQPEGTKTFTQYLETAVSQSRIDKGRELLREHAPLLKKISAHYGVQPQFIVALWGIETNYGGYTGNFSVIESLATLAYEGRRSEFFKDELIKALQIISQGHITVSDMIGSWAGAMGQCQFMPSSFLNFAQDYNGDGRKDIWGTLPDVFASIANYLKQSRWDGSQPWGVEVSIPPSVTDATLAEGTYLDPAFWRGKGIKPLAGSSSITSSAHKVAVAVPGERDEPTYLVSTNYDVLLKWNRSRYFATAVGLLSDAIAK